IIHRATFRFVLLAAGDLHLPNGFPRNLRRGNRVAKTSLEPLPISGTCPQDAPYAHGSNSWQTNCVNNQAQDKTQKAVNAEKAPIPFLGRCRPSLDSAHERKLQNRQLAGRYASLPLSA